MMVITTGINILSSILFMFEYSRKTHNVSYNESTEARDSNNGNRV
jgi:hypothetical protein